VDTFLQKQKWNKAAEDYSKVIQASPDDIGAHERRGYAYRNLGKYNEAIADFSKVIDAAEGSGSVSSARPHVPIDAAVRQGGR